MVVDVPSAAEMAFRQYTPPVGNSIEDVFKAGFVAAEAPLLARIEELEEALREVEPKLRRARSAVFAIGDCGRHNEEDPENPLCEWCDALLMGDSEDHEDNVNSLLFTSLQVIAALAKQEPTDG